MPTPQMVDFSKEVPSFSVGDGWRKIHSRAITYNFEERHIEYIECSELNPKFCIGYAEMYRHTSRLRGLMINIFTETVVRYWDDDKRCALQTAPGVWYLLAKHEKIRYAPLSVGNYIEFVKVFVFNSVKNCEVQSVQIKRIPIYSDKQKNLAASI